MKRLIEVSEADGRFVFSIDNKALFSIDEGDLTIDSKKLYEAFFKGLEEKPEYVFHIPDDASKNCKYVAGEFRKIIERVIGRIDAAWFQGSGELELRDKS